jgi:hypothetical protein
MDSNRRRDERRGRSVSSEESGGDGVSRRERHRSSSRRHRDSRRKHRHHRSREGEPEDRSRRHERSEKLAEFLGYSNEENPFGDPNLTKQFVWKKNPRAAAVAGPEPERDDKIVRELRAVEERRKRREVDQAEYARLRAEEDRLRDIEAHGDYETQERAFERKQHQRRTIIRVKEGRERPSDLMIKNLIIVQAGRRAHRDEEAMRMASDPAVTIELDEPFVLIEQLPSDELKALVRDVELFEGMGAEADGSNCQQECEEAGETARDAATAQGMTSDDVERAVMEAKNDVLEAYRAKGRTLAEYWAAIKTVAEDGAARYDAQFSGKPTGVGGLHHSAEKDVLAMLEPRDLAGLRELEAKVRSHKRAAEEAASMAAFRGEPEEMTGSMTSLEYWASVLRALEVVRSKLVIRQVHKQVLAERLEQLHGFRKSHAVDVEVDAAPVAVVPIVSAPAPVLDDGAVSPRAVYGEDAEAAVRQATEAELEVFDLGSLRTALEVDRVATLKFVSTVASSGVAHVTSSAMEEEALRPRTGITVNEAIEKGLLRDEEDVFASSGEVFADPALEGTGIVASSSASLADRFRPRKPRYYNKVKTGFAWNSHNRAFYDKDTPPPKLVQGYKFNIFYPDLMDPSTTPRFFIEPADSPAFCILRFHGGPPYEDVAFKIVNGEWMRGPNSGYLCMFDHGVFKLYFNFKAHRYRR